jgi:hypothetical protein
LIPTDKRFSLLARIATESVSLRVRMKVDHVFEEKRGQSQVLTHISIGGVFLGTVARPLRIEYPGAIYHVLSRGDRREAIFRTEADRKLFLDLLDQTHLSFGGRSRSYATCRVDSIQAAKKLLLNAEPKFPKESAINTI